VGGRLRFFLPFWESLTSDVFILDAIQGVKIDFTSEVEQNFVPKQISCSRDVKLKIDSTIDKFICTGIIEEVNHCLVNI